MKYYTLKWPYISTPDKLVDKSQPERRELHAWRAILENGGDWPWSSLVGPGIELLRDGWVVRSGTPCGQSFIARSDAAILDVLGPHLKTFTFDLDQVGRCSILMPRLWSGQESETSILLNEVNENGQAEGRLWFTSMGDSLELLGVWEKDLNEGSGVFGDPTCIYFSEDIFHSISEYFPAVEFSAQEPMTPDQVVEAARERRRDQIRRQEVQAKLTWMELSESANAMFDGTLDEVLSDLRPIGVSDSSHFTPDVCFRIVGMTAELRDNSGVDRDYICSRYMVLFAAYLKACGLAVRWVMSGRANDYRLLFVEAGMHVDLFGWFQLLIKTTDVDERKLAVNMGYALKFPNTPEVPLPSGYLPAQVV